MLLGSVLQFRFPDHRIDNPIAALQRTFLGQHVPVEAFQVNMTTLSPQKLCSHLQFHNPGTCTSFRMQAFCALVDFIVQQSSLTWAYLQTVVCCRSGVL